MQGLFERVKNDDQMQYLCSGLRIEATIIGNGELLRTVDHIWSFKGRLLQLFRSVAGSKDSLKYSLGIEHDFELYVIEINDVATNFKKGLETAKELKRFNGKDKYPFWARISPFWPKVALFLAQNGPFLAKNRPFLTCFRFRSLGRDSNIVNPLTKSTIHCLLQSIGFINPLLADFDPRWPKNADNEWKPFDPLVIATASVQTTALAASRVARNPRQLGGLGLYIDLSKPIDHFQHFSDADLAWVLQSVATPQKGINKFRVSNTAGHKLFDVKADTDFRDKIALWRDKLIKAQGPRGYFLMILRRVTIESHPELIVRMFDIMGRIGVKLPQPLEE